MFCFFFPKYPDDQSWSHYPRENPAHEISNWNSSPPAIICKTPQSHMYSQWIQYHIYSQCHESGTDHKIIPTLYICIVLHDWLQYDKWLCHLHFRSISCCFLSHKIINKTFWNVLFRLKPARSGVNVANCRILFLLFRIPSLVMNY